MVEFLFLYVVLAALKKRKKKKIMSSRSLEFRLRKVEKSCVKAMHYHFMTGLDILDHSCLLLAEVGWRFGASSVICNVIDNFKEI